MMTIPSTQARQQWAQTVKLALKEPVMVTDNGKSSVMILDVEVAQRALQALEDYEDALEAQEAADAIANGERTIPLEDIARELGFDLD